MLFFITGTDEYRHSRRMLTGIFLTTKAKEYTGNEDQQPRSIDTGCDKNDLSCRCFQELVPGYDLCVEIHEDVIRVLRVKLHEDLIADSQLPCARWRTGKE